MFVTNGPLSKSEGITVRSSMVSLPRENEPEATRSSFTSPRKPASLRTMTMGAVSSAGRESKDVSAE
jgi:hypothetical protein